MLSQIRDTYRGELRAARGGRAGLMARHVQVAAVTIGVGAPSLRRRRRRRAPRRARSSCRRRRSPRSRASRAVDRRARRRRRAALRRLDRLRRARHAAHPARASASQLQRSLIRSHAAGSGAEVEREVVRALMLLRLSTLATGRTGVRLETATRLRRDAQRRHHAGRARVRLARLLGRPRAARALRAGADGGGAGARRRRARCATPARRCVERRIEPVVLHEKEGLALINGTDGMLGMLVAGDRRPARRCSSTADITAAMSVEGLLGTDRVFAADLHALRPQAGQAASAREHARAARRQPDRRQPPRPGGHARAGRVLAALRAAGRRRRARHASRTRRTVAERELAAAIDNPVVTADGRVESNGNFHGAPIGYVLDFLAIAAADVASMSERRTDRFLDVARNHGLPPFLADDPGRRLGLHDRPVHAGGDRLRAQAPRRARERRLDPELARCRRTTSRWAGPPARKLRRALDGLTRVLAIELLTAARGIELRAPLTPGARHRRGDRRAARRPGPAPTASSPPRSRPPSPSSRSGGAAARRRIRHRRAAHDRPTIRAARGTELSCRGWQQEAALRMLQNNLDPEVAEHPEELVVYGGTGKAARDWASFDAIVAHAADARATTRRCSCSPASRSACMQTHEWAPRVLIANSNLVGDWANWDEFRRLEALGLTMYGQMTAGLVDLHRHPGHPAGHLRDVRGGRRASASAARWPGTITLTGGLGGMGGAQPLAVTMAGGVAICVEVDPSRIARRLETGYLDVEADDIDHALRARDEARDAAPLSIGLLGNCADVFPELLRRGAPIDIVTDQTSAHDPLAYLPSGHRFEDWAEARDAARTSSTARASRWPATSRRWSASRTPAPRSSTTATRSAPRRKLGGYERAFDYPGFVPAYIRPLFCEGRGPVPLGRAVRRPGRHRRHRPGRARPVPGERVARALDEDGRREGRSSRACPARICWLGAGRAPPRRPGASTSSSRAARSPPRS